MIFFTCAWLTWLKLGPKILIRAGYWHGLILYFTPIYCDQDKHVFAHRVCAFLVCHLSLIQTMSLSFSWAIFYPFLFLVPPHLDSHFIPFPCMSFWLLGCPTHFPHPFPHVSRVIFHLKFLFNHFRYPVQGP